MSENESPLMRIAKEALRIEKPTRVSIVRRNLLTRRGYTPYCGNERCRTMPRTRFTGKQFRCGCCGWESSYEPEFIEQYKK